MMMIKFKTFLSEATTEPSKQTHLPHSTEFALHGHEGVGATDATLRATHNYLLGNRRNVPDRVEKKIDGAPAFHIGKDPQGRVFVATKSLFNKDPKINYTEEDIQRNHGHAPGLVSALTNVLNHAHKVLPSDMKPGEMYKGDFLFGGEGKPLEDRGEHVSSQPNLLRYKWQKGTPEAEKASNAKVGVAIHTFFNKKGEAQPISEKQRAKFVDHPDVFNYDPTVSINPQNYTPQEQKAFETHMENARKSYSRIKPDVYDRLTGHGDSMTAFINSRVRSGQQGSGKVEEYLNFLNARAQKDIDSVKTQASKDAKTKKHAAVMQQVIANSKDAQNILDMHGHFQNAKHVLLGVMNKNSSETVEMPDGTPTGHEGYVVTGKDGQQSKIVDQTPEGFANLNLSGKGRIGGAKESVNESLGATTSSKHRPTPMAFRQSVHIQPRSGSEQIPVRSSVAARRNMSKEYAATGRNQIRVREENEQSDSSDSVVAHYGKWRIPHRGYGEVVNKIAEVAKKTGSDSEIALSGASNPLSYESKVRHARNMFPQANITSTKHKNYLEHATDLNKRGYKTLHVVVGSDRAEEFKNTLERYNGVPDKKGNVLYHFPGGIHVHTAGQEREEGSQGVAGSSSTNQERYARAGDFNSFAKNAPAGAKPEHVKALYDEVRSNLTENFTSAVRGLGYVTGDPTVQNVDIQNYFNTNTQESQRISDDINSKSSDNKLVGFKSFNAKDVNNNRDKTLSYWYYDDNGNPFLIDLMRKRQS